MINLFQRWASVSCIVAAGLWAAGCEKPADVAPPVVEEHADHDHDHAEGEDHSHTETPATPPAEGTTPPAEGATPPAETSSTTPPAGGSTISFGDL